MNQNNGDFVVCRMKQYGFSCSDTGSVWHRHMWGCAGRSGIFYFSGNSKESAARPK